MITTEEALQQIQAIASRETEDDEAPAEAFGLLKEAGLLEIVLPGKMLDFDSRKTSSLLALLKEVGRASLSVGRIYEGHINALFLIHLYANDSQKKQWFADAEAGCLFSVWNTEAANGLRIEPSGEHSFQLSGEKTFASGAGLVDRALVTGVLRNGDKDTWQMTVINTKKLPENQIDKGSWKPMGMKSSMSYTFDFSGYEGNTNELIGAPDAYYRQPYFSGGAIRFAAVQLGGAEALFNHTVNYLKQLHRTGDPFQNARIAQMAVALSSGNLWISQSGAKWDEWNHSDADSHRLIAFANMTRTAIERICLDVVELCCKCVGARGLQQPFTMERMVRDLLFYLRQPAPDATLLSIANFVLQAGNKIENVWNETN